jgi:hypothetical protein
MVLNFGGKPPEDLEELPEDQNADPNGSAEEVRHLITQALPGVDCSDPTWGIYTGDEFSFEFNTGKEDPIESLMVHTRDHGQPISSLLIFANPNKWSLVDCSTSQLIDPHNPSDEGWQGFQVVRDKVAKIYGDESPENEDAQREDGQIRVSVELLKSEDFFESRTCW